MRLSELTGKLQSLCHDGYSLSEVKFSISGKVYTPSGMTVIFHPDAVQDGNVKIGKNIDGIILDFSKGDL